ncbi:MAG: prepilin-type N-terminal cleavage/methylation domain-containing protein [Fimbriimonas sp.]
MKKAFTLIELLVVIAIIAILAAILFPVFAQAKAAAKKTAAISNQKQISMGIFMYSGDYDDMYPRNDDCVLGSALNPKFKAAAYNGSPTAGCGFPATGGGPGAWNRANHYNWQKWVMPYLKSVDLLFHPVKGKDAANWDLDGQLMGSFALNISLTGQLDSWNKAPTAARSNRQSFLGGSQTSIPNVSATMLLFDVPLGKPGNASPTYNFAPGMYRSAEASSATITLYPLAVREYWASQLLKLKPGGACGTMAGYGNENTGKDTNGGVVVGFADGSAKWIPTGKFLGNTPTAAEYGAMSSGQACGDLGTSSAVLAAGEPNLSLNYPMWGLGQ